MIWPLLMACKMAPNKPPKFQSVNGEKVKFLLGIAYMPNDFYLEAELGGRLELELDVVDRQGDDFQVLIPGAPPGLDFPPDGLTGHWDVPEDYWDGFVLLEVVVQDERGAADVLYIPVLVPGTDSGDSGFFPGASGVWVGDGALDDAGAFSGMLAWGNLVTGCVWAWTDTAGAQVTDDCPDCDVAWRLDGDAAQRFDGECTADENATPTRSGFGVGFASSLTIQGFELTDVVLIDPDGTGEWLPVGEGELTDTSFSFEAGVF
jgi:hypothetical protein